VAIDYLLCMPLSRVGCRIEKSACIIPVQPDNLHVWVVVTRAAASGPRCRWSLDNSRVPWRAWAVPPLAHQAPTR
jgi:hypothetical protein